MIGIHLHDIKGLDDHFAPGQGEMKFEKITPFLKPDIVRIIEVHSKVKRKELKRMDRSAIIAT
jgi:sugar phosphate isomerase/epimerase